MEMESEYRYRTYNRPIPATWWLRNRRYFLFMIRELTSVFVALFVLLYLYEIFLLTKGPAVYGKFQESLRSGPFIAFYVIVLLFAIFHSITWLGLVPKIQIVRLGRMTVPPILVAVGSYIAWIVASAVVATFFFTLT